MFFSSLALYIEVWEVDQTVQPFFSDVIMEAAWTKFMLNPYILKKSWKMTFEYSTTLILHVHSPMCLCNTGDDVSLEGFVFIKLHCLIPYFYKMKDAHNWPHLSLVCGVAGDLYPIKVVFPEFTMKECLNKKQSVNSPFPVSLVHI